MSVENEQIFRRWVEGVWNERNESVIDELFAEDGIAICPNNLPASPVRGIDAFKEFFRYRLHDFREFSMMIKAMVSENDKVTAQCVVNGLRQEKTNPDSHREIKVSGLYMVRIEDRKIKEAWHGFDFDNRFAGIDDLMRSLKVFLAVFGGLLSSL